jgi:acyl carrier protein
MEKQSFGIFKDKELMMMDDNDDIYEKVRLMMQEVFEVPAEKITPDAKLVEDLEVDSVYATVLLTELEMRFGIVISDEEFPIFYTVQDIVDYVTPQVQSKNEESAS